jgi:antitoxin (DNA-binding transcriptional repressor) of toxin-antitoxin stability system
MTDNGEYITVDVGEMGLAELVEKVRQTGRPVRVCAGGKAVVDVSPVQEPQGLPPMDPRLKVQMLVPGHELTTEEDWPKHLRIDVPPRKGEG